MRHLLACDFLAMVCRIADCYILICMAKSDLILTYHNYVSYQKMMLGRMGDITFWNDGWVQNNLLQNKMCVRQSLPVPVITCNLFYDITAFIIWSLAVIHQLLWLASLMKKNFNMHVNVYSSIPWLPQYLWSGISIILISVIKIIS